jgi:hypothetical protein
MPRVNGRLRHLIADQERPHSANTDAERSILGAILLNNSYYSQASNLAPDDFFLDSHRRIYKQIRYLAEACRPIDIITLKEELDRRNELEMVGDVGYISGLVDGVPDRPGVERYVQIVRQYAARRRFAKSAENAQQLAFDPSVPTSALAEVGTRMSEIAETSGALPPQFSEEALALRFSRQYADSLRYVNDWGRWMKWDGTRWREDRTLHVFDKARAICRQVSAECGNDQKNGVRIWLRN